MDSWDETNKNNVLVVGGWENTLEISILQVQETPDNLEAVVVDSVSELHMPHPLKQSLQINQT